MKKKLPAIEESWVMRFSDTLPPSFYENVQRIRDNNLHALVRIVEHNDFDPDEKVKTFFVRELYERDRMPTPAIKAMLAKVIAARGSAVLLLDAASFPLHIPKGVLVEPVE